MLPIASERNGQTRTRCAPLGRRRSAACREFDTDGPVTGSLAVIVASANSEAPEPGP